MVAIVSVAVDLQVQDIVMLLYVDPCFSTKLIQLVIEQPLVLARQGRCKGRHNSTCYVGAVE